MLTVLDLFSGIGGISLGLESTGGFRTVGFCEVEPFPCAVLECHWPGVPIFHDIREVSGELVRERCGAVDVVAGGFPCQDVSQAGRRAGLAGARSGLWWEFRRILEELHPTWCVIENVPGLLSSNGTEDMGAVLWSLGELGYGYAYRVLDAQWLGVAQRRERVFIVGNARDWAGPAEVLLEPEGVPRNPPARGEAGQGVARPLGCPSATCGGFRDGALVAPTLRSGGTTPGSHRKLSGLDEMPLVAGTLNAGAHPGGCNGQDAYNDLLVPASFNPQSGGDCRGLDIERERARALHSSQTPAVVVPFDTHTEVAGHGAGVRRLMPVECERLQGFPDGWTDVPGTSDSARYRQLGNAVAVTVAEWIGRRIISLRSRAAGIGPAEDP